MIIIKRDLSPLGGMFIATLLELVRARHDTLSTHDECIFTDYGLKLFTVEVWRKDDERYTK